MCPLLNSYSVTYPGIFLGGKSYLFTALQSLWILSALKHQLESCTFRKQPQDSRIFSWGSLVTGATRPLAKAVFLDCKLDSREPEQHPKARVSLFLPPPFTFPPSQSNPKTCRGATLRVRVLWSVGGATLRKPTSSEDPTDQEPWRPGDFSELFLPNSSTTLWVHQAWLSW